MTTEKINSFLLGLLSILLIIGCQEKPEEKGKFSLFTYRSPKGHLSCQLSTYQAIEKGFRIPSWKEKDKLAHFHFEHEFSNQSGEPQEYYYKIYYQNESYKFQETLSDGSYNSRSSDNFYGSWEDLTIGFKSLGKLGVGESKKINDSIAILGNPRGEYRFFGLPRTSGITDAMIDHKIYVIRSTPEWLASIESKAKENNNSLDKQLFIDAIWSINDSLKGNIRALDDQRNVLSQMQSEAFGGRNQLKALIQEVDKKHRSLDEVIANKVREHVKENDSSIKLFENNRFKRNPRVGTYNFMLVVVSEKQLDQIPDHIQFINQKKSEDEGFVNPFYFFENQWKSEDQLFYGDKLLKLNLSLDGAHGVYVNPNEFRTNEITKEYYNELVGNSKQLFKNAHFEQYFHVINYDFELKNIPIIADVTNNYNQSLYHSNLQKFPIDERAITHPTIPHQPGKTVYYDSTNHAIVIENPGNKSLEKVEKQNVGIKSRHGLTYGKYTAKIKFPDMLSEDYVWNGITCAFWLFSEEMNEWNSRSVCESGYRPKGETTDKEKVRKSSYSEIDIEIVKTSKYWPKSSYWGSTEQPQVDNAAQNDDLIIGATNWDLACQDPRDFHQGVQAVNYAGKKFELHRWDEKYQAATSKYAHPHDKTVGSEIFYQIEWRPDEIIWRIGKDKNNMEVIGYMSEKQTKIPDNQMISIVTQEFHYSDWWPLSPYDQNNIPYPKKPLKGYVYEVEVE